MPALLKRLLLEHGEVRAESTPRRLSVLVPNLAPRQPDVQEDIRGPPVKVHLRLACPAHNHPCTCKQFCGPLCIMPPCMTGPGIRGCDCKGLHAASVPVAVPSDSSGLSRRRPTTPTVRPPKR